ncbi:hypothetical protein [Luteimonas aquatica]|uniref:hypothetical protein n=1 Tax=Luteimonas aquatica TaxID=450364 RepID=UPI001F59344E|nr:hypothetical protein [Luteimonas aquatica]
MLALYRDAFGDMPEYAYARVRLGTCIPAVNAERPGQKACAVAVTIGAGTLETQADFHWNGCAWEARSSTSQDHLPFPDPKLAGPTPEE